ncbi:MAG: hypothetical protein K9F92_00720 [Candidatus Nanopelagicaceae bacterium]|nr:hypothetical protein [Candidatus Nanopelagicaceae bacterium]
MAKKLAFLVIAHNSPKYNRLRKWQEKTWVRDFNDFARVFYVYGEESLEPTEDEGFEKFFEDPTIGEAEFTFPIIRERNGDLFCDSTGTGGWSELLPNTLTAFKYLLDNYNFDFIIRTNLSTYWNQDKLMDLIEEQDSDLVFMGPTVSNDKETFVAGYAMIFSRNTIRKLIDNPDLINFKNIDDVAISNSLVKQSIYPTNIELPWVTIRNYASLFLPTKLRRYRPLAINSILDLSRSIGIRCREDRRIGPYNFRIDFVHYALIRLFATMAKCRWIK